MSSSKAEPGVRIAPHGVGFDRLKQTLYEHLVEVRNPPARNSRCRGCGFFCGIGATRYGDCANWHKLHTTELRLGSRVSTAMTGKGPMRVAAIAAAVVALLLSAPPVPAAGSKVKKDLRAYLLRRNDTTGNAFYHQRGHRRTLEVIVRTLRLKGGTQLQVWFHGHPIGRMRVKDGRAHMLHDTAAGQRVPRVHETDGIKVRKRSGQRKRVTYGTFYDCHMFANGCWR